MSDWPHLLRASRPWVVAAALVVVLLAVVLFVAPAVPAGPFIYQRF